MRKTVTILESMLLKVKREFMNGSLEWTTQIKKLAADDEFFAYEEAKKQKMLPWLAVEIAEQTPQTSSIQIDSFLNAL